MSEHIFDDIQNLTPKAILEALERGDIRLEFDISRAVYGERDGKKVIESCVINGVLIVRAK